MGAATNKGPTATTALLRLAQGGILLTAAVTTVLARWPDPPQPPPVVAEELPIPQHAPRPAAAADAECGPGQAPRDALDPWEAARARAEGEIARLHDLRAALEGDPAAPGQDPESLEPALVEAAALQPEIDLTLEAIDCSEYPCLATFRSDETDAHFRRDTLVSGLRANPGWAHREFGGIQSPLGDGEYLILLAIWEELPTSDEEARLHARMGALVSQAREGEP